MSVYLLGIDQGGTVSKVLIMDVEGRELLCVSERAEVLQPQPGWVERDMEATWQGCAALIRRALDQAGISAARIAAVGIAGHGNGLYLLDRSGAPLRRAILSTDTRAATELARWQARGVDQRAWQRALQQLWPGQTATLLHWLKRHEPERYHAIGAVLLCKDYLTYRLTGALGTDFSDISATGLFDPLARGYAADLLELFEIPEIAAALPPVAPGSQVVGRVTPEAAAQTGLAAGTPVAAGMLDVSATTLGAGVIAPGQACMIVGTWSANALVVAQPIHGPRIFLNALFMPESWLALEASASSASSLEWFIAQLCAEEREEAVRRGISVYAVCDERVAALPPGGAPIIYHPFLFGAGPDASARAGFYGLAGWHTRLHMLRAVYEGIAYGHRLHLEQLLASGPPAGIRLAGGGARSRVWSQIFADVLQQELEVPEGSELGARGAALCAGVGAGLYAGYADAVATAVRVERRHLPDPGSAPYYALGYAEYRATLATMRETWRRLSEGG